MAVGLGTSGALQMAVDSRAAHAKLLSDLRRPHPESGQLGDLFATCRLEVLESPNRLAVCVHRELSLEGRRVFPEQRAALLNVQLEPRTLPFQWYMAPAAVLASLAAADSVSSRPKAPPAPGPKALGSGAIA